MLFLLLERQRVLRNDSWLVVGGRVIVVVAVWRGLRLHLLVLTLFFFLLLTHPRPETLFNFALFFLLPTKLLLHFGLLLLFKLPYPLLLVCQLLLLLFDFEQLALLFLDLLRVPDELVLLGLYLLLLFLLFFLLNLHASLARLRSNYRLELHVRVRW